MAGTNTQKMELVSVLLCEVRRWPMTHWDYLQMTRQHRGNSVWYPVVENVEKRLDGWSKEFLSQGGRL